MINKNHNIFVLIFEIKQSLFNKANHTEYEDILLHINVLFIAETQTHITVILCNLIYV